jgi:SAM-dependent methyltransferase
VNELFERFGLGEDDVAAWRASGLSEEALEDWVIDRVARRPEGARARERYGGDEVHASARRAILGALGLGAGDAVLDIGCGGGLLLRDVTNAGASATGIDHSEEMVALARERAPGADVMLGRAERLPFADESFTAVTLCVVFFFLEDPVAVLRECRRVLLPGGRVAAYTTAPELRGTPAAPEPIASRGHFYEDAELAALAREAGFADVEVSNDDGGQLVTGVHPESTSAST